MLRLTGLRRPGYARQALGRGLEASGMSPPLGEVVLTRVSGPEGAIRLKTSIALMVFR